MAAVLLDSLSYWRPEAILSLGALLVLVAGAFTRRSQPALGIAWAAILAAVFALLQTPVPPPTQVFYGLITCDSFSLAFRWVALLTTALVLVMAASVRRDVDEDRRGEYFSLFLFTAVGLMLMAEANHLLMAYLAMEMVSLSAYLLVGIGGDRRSAEAALKYLVFGALSSAVMLFGMSLLFGLTNDLSFAGLSQVAYLLGGDVARAKALAVLLMLVGLAFKVSMVPFHQWTPDVYEGAPIAVTALLSVGPKAAGLALMVRLMQAVGSTWLSLAPILLALTMVTMTVGNLVALMQTNVKRLLAYSTIGQVGYMLIALTIASADARQALIVYLFAYLFMNLGAFACVAAVFNDTGFESVHSFQGLAQRAPGLAAGFAILLLSLAGLPPLFGFVGKFLLFGSALGQGQVVLAVVAALNSAIALYYYVVIIRHMYFAKAVQTQPVVLPVVLRFAVAGCVAATLIFGINPTALLDWLKAAQVTNLL